MISICYLNREVHLDPTMT